MTRSLYVSAYVLEDCSESWQEIADACKENYWECEDAYEELLSEVYPEVEIGYSYFTAGEIVRQMSPTDFRIGVVDEYTSISEDEYPEVFKLYYDEDDSE